MTDAPRTRIHWLFPVVLLVAGAFGLLAAFELTLDKFAVLADKNAILSCNVNLFIQCGKNLTSPQGAVFGFPNPLIGVMSWPAVIVVAMGVLAGARFARWFWLVFNLGLTGALVFCAWLIGQSFYVLGTICPWCVLTWAMTILAFVATTAMNLSRGVFGRGGRRAGRGLLRWSPLVVVGLYLVIAALAQVRFDLIHTGFGS